MRKLNSAGIGRFFSSLAAKGHGIIGHPPLNEPFPGINNPQTMVHLILFFKVLSSDGTGNL